MVDGGTGRRRHGTDLAKAKTLYSRLLGVPPEMDEPYYVGWNVKGQDVRLDPHG
jgi:hypothetical protein